jgi:hypothetical protein
MIADMAKRTRLILDIPEEVRLAVKLAATRMDVGISAFVTEVLRKALPTEIKDAAKYMPKKEKGQE